MQQCICLCVTAIMISLASWTNAQVTIPPATANIRVGIIGLDTSHAPAFAKLLNDPDVKPDLAGCRVLVAYPMGSKDIKSSVSRIPQYTQQLRDMHVDIVDSIPALLQRVDVVLLETNDGRPHLAQALQVIHAKKRLFIDKPLAGSLQDCLAIYAAAKRANVPVFSSSSLRYTSSAQALRLGKMGAVLGCDAYSPSPIEPTHPDLFWYGIHGVETLFTVMGKGCKSVNRTHTNGTDLVVGVWNDGRIGTFRGTRTGKHAYGGTAFTTQGVQTLAPYQGYRPMLVEVVRFFRTGISPIDPDETLEIYAFMAAAQKSRELNGATVTLESVLHAARVADD